MTMLELNKLRKGSNYIHNLKTEKEYEEDKRKTLTSTFFTTHPFQQSIQYNEECIEKLCEKIVIANLDALKYIAKIEDAQTQLIFRYRFINNFSWVKIAHIIGGGNTEDSVRMRVKRYLEKNQ